MPDTVHILYHYLKTKYGRSFQTREQLKRYQHKKVKKQLNFVLKHSPFYKELYEERIHEHGIENWREFPIIEKKAMMEHFDLLNTREIKKAQAFELAIKSEESRDFTPMIADVTIGLSSGTSGNRGLFLVSKSERNRWAGTVLAKLLPDGILSIERIAFFLRANSNLYESVGSKRIQFQFFDLLVDVEKHIKTLNEYKPTILVAPPSLMRMLATAIQGGKLKINPKKIITVAEVLDPLDKKYIENHFGQMVHQVYQCTEGFLATTCEYGTLHLNEDLVVIQKEFLDEDRFSLIITDFSRTTQPILRYRLNDILTVKKEGCKCGSVFTAIEQIEGRCDDIFYFQSPTTDNKIRVFPDFIRRIIISSSDKIEEYQAIQHSLERIEICLTLPKEVQREELYERIRNLFQDYCARQKVMVPNITFSEHIQNEKGKKLRRVERRF